jgi:hypothetical protein
MRKGVMTMTTNPNKVGAKLRAEFTASLLPLLLLLLLPVAGRAQFTYFTNYGSITITGYTGTNADVVIPSAINGLPVTEIGEVAFSYGSLSSVTIPNSVTSIGGQAFFGCSALTYVMIPNSVANIANGAFGYCANLAAILVDGNNSNYGSLDGVLFNQDQTTLLQWPQGKAASYTIPSSVTSIEDNAFGGSSLTNVTIPNGVISIGNGAFAGCASLTKSRSPTASPASGTGHSMPATC